MFLVRSSAGLSVCIACGIDSLGTNVCQSRERQLRER